MYQPWPTWGGTTAAAASPTAAGYVQPAAAGTVAATQWPANYNQFASVTPEFQQQWAAWASQAQYAYSGAVPVAGQVPTTTANPYSGYPETQTSDSNAQTASEKPKNSSEEAPLDQEEEEFDRQFKEWEKQFEAWKEQNINHPDKEAFAQYEKQWQEWRAQLLQKKEQMQKEKAARLAQSGNSIATTVSALNTSTMPTTTSSGAVDPSVVANPLYYQQAQYMYMQPYVYPGTVPVAPTVPSQFSFGGQSASVDSFGGQQPMGNNGEPQMNVPNSNMNLGDAKSYDQENEQYKYGHGAENFPHQDDSYGNYDDYGNSTMYPPPDMEDPYQREMNFGRGRAKGRRGRARGRGRWSEPNDMEGQPPPNMRSQGPALLDNPPEFPDGPGKFRDGPGDFPEGPGGFPSGRFSRGPPRDFPPGPGEFGDSPRKFPEGPGDFPPGPKNRPPFDYPPDGYPEDYPDGQNFPEDHPRQRRNFPSEERFPFRDGQPPHREGKPPLLPRDGQKPLLPQEDRPPLLRDGQPLLHDGQPPFEGQQPLLRDRPPGQFPPGEFDEPYPPEAYDDRFPPDSDRFPPGPKDDHFMMDRKFDGYPPMDDRGFGPPPFSDDFPPFDDRFPPGRGRFPPRGRRFPPGHRDFDRFGPPNFPPGMRDDGPPFGPDDRYPFPGDGPPRMGHPGRGGHRPPFGPGNHPRFPPDEPYFRDGGPPPMRFKSVDYTHRSSADFDPHYDFESEFQDDVGQFRAVPMKRNKRSNPRKAPVEKKIRD